MTNEKNLFDCIYFGVKAVVYTYIFFYACNIIKEHNMLMGLVTYTCDECLDKENLEINDNDNNKSS